MLISRTTRHSAHVCAFYDALALHLLLSLGFSHTELFVYLPMMVIKISWLFGNRNQITAAGPGRSGPGSEGGKREGEEESSMAMARRPKGLC